MTKRLVLDRYYWELVREIGYKAACWRGYRDNPYIPRPMVESARIKLDGLILAARWHLTQEYPGDVALFEEEMAKHLVEASPLPVAAPAAGEGARGMGEERKE